MKKLTGSLPFRLLLGVVIGILVGQFAGEGLMNIVVTLKYIMNQIISFCVPLIVIGFIAPSITKLGNNASKMLGVAVVIAYVSSVGAALFSMAAGYLLIPHLSIVSEVDGLKELPGVVFQLDIPQIMPVMSALVFSLFIGLAATWTKATVITNVLDEFQKIVLEIVTRVVIPILPVFIAFTFCALSYEGTITKQLPVFLKVDDHRYDWPFHLDGSVIWYWWRLRRKESDECGEKLRSCLHYCSRNDVFRSYSGSCPALCPEI